MTGRLDTSRPFLLPQRFEERPSLEKFSLRQVATIGKMFRGGRGPHRKYSLRVMFPRNPFLAATGAQLTSLRRNDEMLRTMRSAQVTE